MNTFQSPNQFPVETWGLRAFLSQRWMTQDWPRQLPKVSVVMPAFNQVNFIERTLLSILNQNYPHLELIVIDGGSTDGTVEVLERYREHIAYFYSGPDKGQSDALNHGFSKATGEIFAWMNSDDLYLPGAIYSAVAAFESSPSASVVFGDWWSVDSDDAILDVNHAFDFNMGHFLYEGFHLNSQAMFWRREAHQRFGEFDVNLHSTMDYDLILRLGLVEGEGRFLRMPYPLACFRRHPNQKTKGMSQPVIDEHRVIAFKNGLARKYTISGRVMRLVYRARRAWWYLKRDGLDFTVARIRNSL